MLPLLKDSKTDFTKIVNLMLKFGDDDEKKFAHECRQGIYARPFDDPLIRQQVEKWYLNYIITSEKE